MNENDQKYMEMAIKEAKKSKAEDKRVHPKVGVVIVIKDKLEGKAHRGERGAGDHAEYTALEKKYRKKAIAGATVYVTLEPCTTRNHRKTPCADWLIERKVGRVVVGMLDPNPQICGKGIRRLRDANIAVDLFPPDLMAQVEEQNREFIREYQTDSFKVPSELNRGAGANLINPHYSKDCQLLDNTRFVLKTIIGKETIFIVIGDGLVSALLDHPVVGVLASDVSEISFWPSRIDAGQVQRKGDFALRWQIHFQARHATAGGRQGCAGGAVYRLQAGDAPDVWKILMEH
jgi:pyrimidine deaminase RibD-like protein